MQSHLPDMAENTKIKFSLGMTQRTNFSIHMSNQNVDNKLNDYLIFKPQFDIRTHVAPIVEKECY